jgi:ribulose-5-phosphate 4-epimerase/fuculose-1-phosphate aldolase
MSLKNNKKKDQAIKYKLELLFKILDYYKLNDLTANHASILSSDKKGFYINQHKYLFKQIKANNLKYVNLKEEYNSKYHEINKAGLHIHKFLHNSIAKPRAILHTHSINGVAISCLKEGFNEKLNQSSMRFFGRIKYFNYNGMVIDNKVAKELCSKIQKDTKIIILKNHGVILLAQDIEELFHLTFHFEKCSEIQLKLLNNKVLNKVSDRVAKLTCKQHENFGKVGHMSWEASTRILKKID